MTGSGIRRAPRPDSNFYHLDKTISEDSRLSWEARGMLIFLLGKPDNWCVSVAHLIKQTSDCKRKSSGRDAVRAILSELGSVGYLQKGFARNDSGVFQGVEYIVHEIPYIAHPETEYPAPAYPKTDNPAPAEPSPANPPLIKTDSLVKTENSKQLGDSGESPMPGTNHANVNLSGGELSLGSKEMFPSSSMSSQGCISAGERSAATRDASSSKSSTQDNRSMAAALAAIPAKKAVKAKRVGVNEGLRMMPIPVWLPRESWLEFCTLREEHKKGVWSELAAKKIIVELGRLRDQGNDPVEVINASIRSGWVGVFPFKSNALTASATTKFNHNARMSPNDQWASYNGNQGFPDDQQPNFDQQDFIDVEAVRLD